MRLTLDDIFRLAIPGEPAISPDGTTVVYTLHTADRAADENRSALWRVSPGGTPEQLTRGAHDSAPTWTAT